MRDMQQQQPTDSTDYLRGLGALKSQPDNRDFQFATLMPQLTAASKLAAQMVCFSDTGNMGVRDQGAAGSCMAHATALMREYHAAFQQDLADRLSPQYIYDAREDASQPGMQMRDAFVILRKKGVPREQDCPVVRDSDTRKCVLASGAHERATAFKIQSYWRVGSVDEARVALHDIGPVAVAFTVWDVDNAGTRMWIRRPGQTQDFGGHAVTLIAYDDARRVFTYQNSWGTAWGIKGYGVLPYDDWEHVFESWVLAPPIVDEPSSPADDDEPAPADDEPAQPAPVEPVDEEPAPARSTISTVIVGLVVIWAVFVLVLMGIAAFFSV